MSAGPIVGGIIDGLAGVTEIVAERLEERRHEWGRFAATEPDAAAWELDRAASELIASVKAMKPWRQKWPTARRRRAKAAALRELAKDLRRYAEGQECTQNPLRRPL